MRILLLALLIVVPLVASQEEIDDRGLHKRKRRPYQQASPCGGFRDLSTDSSDHADGDGRSLPLVAALGGAAAGYYLGNKFQKHQQQPVINNYVTATAGGLGGSPCGGVAGVGGQQRPIPGVGGLGGLGGGSHLNHFNHGNHLNNHLNHVGSHLNNILASHVGPGGIGGGGGIFGSPLGGNRNGGYGGSVNWDRTIRQFNRQVVRPLTHGWF